MNNVREDDQELIRRSLDGQRDAFGDLVRRYQNRLYNGMVQIIRNESEAEDIVQDAFVLAFSKLDTFKGNSAFFTWLYRIAYNVAISRLRRRKPSVSLHGTGEDDALDFPSSGPSPSEPIEQLERAALLNTALNRLSDEHRAILVLREIDELDYESISEILDLPIGTVRSRIHRARSQLREQIETLDESPMNEK